MKVKKSKKIYYWVHEHVTIDTVKVILLAIPIFWIVVRSIRSEGIDISNYVDVGVLVAFIIAFFCEAIAKLIQKIVDDRFEDYVKISQDADSLVKRYPCEEFISFPKPGKDDELNLYPGILLWKREKEGWRIEIDDRPDVYYKLPGQIASAAESIMKVHKSSTLYNQLNIRLDDLISDEKNNTIKLKTSRTYFFDSLLTNRACDSNFRGSLSIREVYEPGPYFKPLSESRMSNHIGGNGIIITKDEYIPFIHRSRKVSTGKGTWSSSVSASVKTRYAFEKQKPDHRLDEDGLIRAIEGEINEELCIKLDAADRNKILDGVFAFYRDASECGKPQFVFVLRLEKITKDDILRAFLSKGEEAGDITNAIDAGVRKDGKEIRFFSVSDFTKAKLEPGNLIVTEGEGEHKKDTSYKINMATSTALALEIPYLKKICSNE